MDPAIEITRDETPVRGAYRASIDGATAELTWRANGPVRIADHTFVPPELRGKGVAMQLVEALIADARAQGFTIEPRCSYVEAAFRRHPEWADVKAGEMD
ncbi:MAG TPA: GNAT family N-acetyltransferase [Croceibacterium sp.]|nr:GNAT family N-acetyltransferase [Croceibacterium sp.]